jgi:hypothetical protein
MVNVEKYQAQANVISAIVITLLLKHFCEITFVVDSRQAILDRHVPQHHMVFSVVFVLVGELEHNVTDSHLVPFAQGKRLIYRLFIYEAAVGTAQVREKKSVCAMNDHGMAPANTRIGNDEIYIIASTDHRDVFTDFIYLPDKVTPNHHETRSFLYWIHSIFWIAT